MPGRKLQPRRAVTRRGETKGGSAPPSPRPIRTGRDVETASGRRGLHRGAGEPGRARVRSGSQRAAPDQPNTYTTGDPLHAIGKAPCGWAETGHGHELPHQTVETTPRYCRDIDVWCARTWIMGCRSPITRANNCAERVKPRPALNSALRAGGERI